MPRSLSSNLVAAMNQPSGGGQVKVDLIEISHPLINTIRFCNDIDDLTHDGEIYTSFPFYAQVLDDREGDFPRPSIIIDNVDRSVVQQLRALNSEPTIVHKVVIASAPNVVELGPSTYILIEAQYDVLQIVGILSLPFFQSDGFPFHGITQATAPGAFGNAT